MSDIEKIRLFDNQKIRTVWVDEEDEWYFSVKDVVTILTETTNAKDYISKMRRRDEELSKGWGQIVHPLTTIRIPGQDAAGKAESRASQI
jgi:prophage antirepressor-like protein